jgi:hypothetical protein
MTNPSEFVNEIIDWRTRRVNFLKQHHHRDELMDKAILSRLRETVADHIACGVITPGMSVTTKIGENIIALLLFMYVARGGSMTTPTEGSVLDLTSHADPAFVRSLFGPPRTNADGLQVLSVRNESFVAMSNFTHLYLDIAGGTDARDRFLRTLFGPIDARIAHRRYGMIRDTVAGQEYRLATMVQQKTLMAASSTAEVLNQLGGYFQDDIVSDIAPEVLGSLCDRVERPLVVSEHQFLSAWDRLKETPAYLWDVAHRIGALSPSQVIGVVSSYDPTRLLSGLVVFQRVRRGDYGRAYHA